MRYTRISLLTLGCLVFALTTCRPIRADQNPQAAVARTARDQADVESLRKMIDAAQSQAQQRGSAEAYEWLAQLNLWLCEAGHGRNDDKLVKEAAEQAVAAADKAVALSPNSSEAHRLDGEALGELIPHVFAGGMRYGRRSTSELDKAIELDPKNAAAYVGRATDYFFTPSAFGGSTEKAVEFLKKAIALDPSSDTAYIWLAQVYLSSGQHDEAQHAIDEALKLDPGREFARYVQKQVASSAKQARASR